VTSRAVKTVIAWLTNHVCDYRKQRILNASFTKFMTLPMNKTMDFMLKQFALYVK